jgi:hypothetical protein
MGIAIAPLSTPAPLRDFPLRIKRRGVEMRLVIDGRATSPTTPDPVLLKEIRRAHRCFEALVSGQVGSVAELATVEGVSDRYVSSLLPLALVAPDIPAPGENPGLVVEGFHKLLIIGRSWPTGVDHDAEGISS